MQHTARSSAMAIGLALLSGCALSGKLPMNHFDSPENGAAEDSILKMGLSPVDMMNEIMVVPDTTATPPQLNARNAGPKWAVSGSVGVTPPDVKRLEFGGTLRINGPLEAKARYQFLGKIAPEADAGNFAAALVARVGVDGSEGTDNNSTFFGGPTVTAKHRDRTTYFDVHLPFGYRVSRPFSLYTGPYYSQGYFSGHIDQTTSAGGNASYDATATLRQVGGVFGLQARLGKSQWKLEFAASFLPVSYSPTSVYGIGLNIDFPVF